MNRKALLVLFTLAALAAVPALHAATVTIVNTDGANEGYNDPTPVAPIGGNPGTTLGQQRLIAAQFAADIWGSILPSDAPIVIRTQFNPLACSATGAALASAGALQVFANSANAEVPNVWYHVALANKLAGVDQSVSAPGGSGDDLFAQFNTDVDNQFCLGSQDFYYGLDANHGTDTDFIATALHEFGHGLGFANFANELSGTLFNNRGDIFSQYTLDLRAGQTWNQMATNAQRVASAINTNRVVWSGVNVTAMAGDFLLPGTKAVRGNSPAALAGVSYRVGEAQFGAPLSAPGVTGDVVLATDADEDGAVAAFTGTDGCSAITNDVAGKIALVDRGGCSFVVKAANVQNAGAIAMVVANNAAGSPPGGMSGVDANVTIPSVLISRANGNEIKASLPANVTVGIFLDGVQGADAETGQVLLNAPDPATTGSSISHWDPVAFNNLLMEPAINPGLGADVDLTLPHFVDIGWFSDFDGVADGVDACVFSDTNANVVIDGCDSGVPNTVFANGCRISDSIAACAEGAGNHGGFVSCVSHYTNSLKKDGVITGAQKGAIQSCAGSANIP